MRFDYRPELEDYRAEVRAFIARYGPGPRKHVGVRAPEPEQVPALRAWVARLYAAGYLGQAWPVEYGGRPGASVQHAFIVAEEIARARTWGEIGAGTLAAGAILAFGSERQRRHYLPRIRSGEDLWCQLFSEPNAGSDLASLKTRACATATTSSSPGRRCGRRTGTTPTSASCSPAPTRRGQTGGHHRVRARHADAGRRGPPAAPDDRDPTSTRSSSTTCASPPIR